MPRPGDRPADPARPQPNALHPVEGATPARPGAAGDARAELLSLLETGDPAGHLALEQLIDRCARGGRP